MAKYFAAFLPLDGEQYQVLFPDLLGIATWGNNLDHAFDSAIEALDVHLTGMYNDNDIIPQPSSYDEAKTKVIAYLQEHALPTPTTLLLQLIPAPELQEKPIKVNTSFKRKTLEMIDKKAEQYGMTRSGFLALAADAYSG